MAKTIASGIGMTNDWLASQGVLSLKTSGQNLLIFVESPSADPHAGWCGEGARKRASLLDFAIVLRLGTILIGSICLAFRVAHGSAALYYNNTHAKQVFTTFVPLPRWRAYVIDINAIGRSPAIPRDRKEILLTRFWFGLARPALDWLRIFVDDFGTPK
jgi:hypothetical protein